MAFSIFILGLILFFGIHLVRVVAPGFRDAQIAANEGRWKGIYSLVSAAGLVLIVWGWHDYRPDAPEIYEPPLWGRHVTMLFVLFAFILLSVPRSPAGYIRHWVKHPMLIGTMLWASGHLLANGDLASLLLFGTAFVWAAVDLIAVIPRGDPAPVVERPRNDVIAIVAGAAIYAVFGLWLHGWLIGVDPFV